MSSESEQFADSNEKQLCVSCMFPNEMDVHFCSKCGAPMTSYAATGPFEHIFAEGHVYRQASERPRSLFVVLGVWFIFGMMAVAAAVTLFFGGGVQYLIGGVFFLLISLAIIWKTTRNYFARPHHDQRSDV